MEENQEEQPKTEEEECKDCQMEPLLIALGATKTACYLVDNDEKKAECNAWLDTIDPKEMKTAENLLSEALDRTGVDALHKATQLFNISLENAVITKVSGMLEEGKEVDKDLMDMYKRFAIKRGI